MRRRGNNNKQTKRHRVSGQRNRIKQNRKASKYRTNSKGP